MPTENELKYVLKFKGLEKDVKKLAFDAIKTEQFYISSDNGVVVRVGKYKYKNLTKMKKFQGCHPTPKKSSSNKLNPTSIISLMKVIGPSF